MSTTRIYSPDEAGWYAKNFANEQILQGKTTQFLRFQNRTNLDVFENTDIWVIPIPEIVNTGGDFLQKGQLFFNGTDIYKLNSLFKDDTIPNFQAPPSLNFFITGGPSDIDGTNANDWEYFRSVYFPMTPIIGLPSSFGATSTISKWYDRPIKPGEKHNFRIDYKGDSPIVVKITFLVVTEDPTSSSFYDISNNGENSPLPMIGSDLAGGRVDNNGVPAPAIGDVRLNHGAGNDYTDWEFYNGSSWVEFVTGGWPLVSPNGSGISPVKPPTFGVKHLHMLGYFRPDDNWNGMWMDFQETYIMCYPEETGVPSKDKDYWLDKTISDIQLHEDKTSYALMRTNPKLSGNIKVVVDTEGAMYMDSIEANDELANARFKKNRLSAGGSYPVDVKKFFGNVSPEILYDIREKDDQYLNTKNNYIDQYDFFYGYGASQLSSKYYDEEFKLFAPIWLRSEMPDFFVIFKVPEPLNKETYFNDDREKIMSEMLSNAQIIESYDLRKGSNVGEYLSKLVEDPRFKDNPLSISYDNDTLSTWSGISYSEGIMSERGEYLYDFIRTDQPINEFEEYVTNGFQRNKMISTNLINLEFVFDDNESEEYDINRYFGMYINEIELAKFELYGNGFDNIDDQSPLPKKDVDAEPYSTREFIQNNDGGIVIPIDYYQGNGPVGQPEYTGLVQGKLPLAESVSDPFRFFYVRDRDDKIDRIKELVDYESGTVGANNYEKFTGLKIYDKTADISKYAGITRLTSQISAKLLDKGHSQIVIDFKDIDGTSIKEGEVLEIEWVDINKDKQLWQCITNPTGIQPGDAWDFPVYNPDKFLYTNTFSPQGTVEDIAKAYTTCINSFDNRAFNAWNDGSKVYIKAELPGESGNGMLFRRKLTKGSKTNSVEFYGIAANFSNQYEVVSYTGNLTNESNIISFTKTDSTVTNDYEVKVTVVNLPVIKFEFRRNGGLLGEYPVVLNGDTEFTYDDITITFSDSLYDVNDTWKLKTVQNTIEQRFVGGNNRNRARNTSKIEELLNIDPDHWYQTQKDKYSRLKTWDIQGTKIFKLPNLENEIFDSRKNLIGYSELGTDEIIQVRDKDFEFYRTEKNKIVGFDAFEPTIGLMSFLPVKDFDFDWVKSDYSYTPNAELFEYYEKIELDANNPISELPLYHTYEITQGKVKLEGYNSTTNTWESVSITDSAIWNGDVEFQKGDDGVKNFNTFLPSYYYDTTKDGSQCILDSTDSSDNYFYRNYKMLQDLNVYTKFRIVNQETETAIIEKYTYSLDRNLTDFNGFLGLSDFFSSEDEEELARLIRENDIDRFFYDQLISEYDRLRENFNKDYAVKSRVVPYINKWVSDGTDCRDNKYRLNNSMAFGVTNFSPDFNTRERDPRLHSHEFYYLDKFPNNYDSEFMPGSRSYFFEPLDKVVRNGKSWYDLLKTNNENDWFDKYFTIGYPNELDSSGTSVEKKTEERYVFTKFVPGNESVQGVFRGGKFRIVDIDPITNEDIDGSTKYEGYKFSSILRIKKLEFGFTEPPTEFEFIANDEFKTIVLVITLYVNDYRLNQGGYGYTFLYAAFDALRAADVKNENLNVYKQYSASLTAGATYSDANTTHIYVDSDFTNSIDTQRHYDGFMGGMIPQYADVKLSGIFNTRLQTVNENPRKLEAITLTANEFIPSDEISTITGNDYDLRDIYTDIEREINNLYSPPSETQKKYKGTYTLDVLENGEYSELSQYMPGRPLSLPLDYIINNQPGTTQNVSVTTSYVEFTYDSGDILRNYFTIGAPIVSGGIATSKQVANPFITPNETYKNSSCWYLSGGKSYMDLRLDTISFGEIVSRVNEQDASVKYYEVSDAGTNDGTYRFEFIESDKIIKENRILVDEDDDKPEAFTDTDLVGFKNTDVKELETIFRHRGRFEPKTRRVLDFWVREDENMTKHYNLDFLLSNTRWNIELDRFGNIDNHYFSKVGTKSLMKIASTSKYRSTYPLINEISIDKKDLFTFNSNWDNNYFSFYQTRYGLRDIRRITNKPLSNIDRKEGTLELTEQKSYFGSKLMNVPGEFILHTFNDSEVTFSERLPLASTDIKFFKKGKKVNSLTPESVKGSVRITINADDRVIREMLENGATKEMLKLKAAGITRFANLTDQQIEEEARKYLLVNILPLYQVSDVTLYIKDDANREIDEIVRIDLSEQQKRSLSYNKSKNTTVNKVGDFKFVINQQTDTKEYKSYSVSITLKRI